MSDMSQESSTGTALSKKRDREVLGLEDFSDADIEAVRRAEPSKEAEAFNEIERPIG